jgi:hypothetical protein
VKDWYAYAQFAFPLSGQMLCIGKKIDTGKPVPQHDIFVVCLFLPAFGSMAGVAALHFGWPTCSILVTVTSAA